ncbi:MAG: DSD1 family PLP-dependent enzyme [Anaerolineaceae bacterium]|nr:DSD1 family PLP-dependent enzyme [Anaerolineaceae bacterium]
MTIGENIYKIDTPALWVDLNSMESNIQLIGSRMKAANVDWRPHTKGIKIPAIAHKLLAAGAIGITCAKLGEAEVMAAGGVQDILIANEVVGTLKIKRLVALRAHANPMVAVDDFDNAREISDLAAAAGRKIRVLLELNIGMERAGLTPGQPTLEFAQKIVDLPGLEFCGVMGWEGHVVGIEDPQEKQQVGEKAIQALVDSANLLREKGIAVPIVSCGGSGSYKISSNVPGVTEIQAGGAILGDQTYEAWGADIIPGLFVMTTVSSHAVPERAIVDAGRKSMNCEVFMPKVTNLEGIELTSLSAEHGVLEIKDSDIKIKVGDRVNFVVGYGDWTVFLHNQMYGVRDDVVEMVWEIQGRGHLT